jgi:phytanoyl-CoA hydroxylase
MNEDRQKFLQQGFLLKKAFLRPKRLQGLLDEIKQIFRTQMKQAGLDASFDLSDERRFTTAMAALFKADFEAFVNCGKQVQHSMNLHRLALDDRIEDLIRSVGLENPNICTRPVLFFNHPSLAKEKVYHTVFPHQDWRSMQGSLDSVVVWCPLLNIDRSMGALKIVPGSHHRGLVSGPVESGFGKVAEELFSEGDWVDIDVVQGDLLIFSAFLVHQSGENITDRIRWSCHFRFNNLDESTFIRRKFHHNYLYQPKTELHTPSFPRELDIARTFNLNE